MINGLDIFEEDFEANPANWIDGHYVGPAAALVMRAKAHHEAQKDAHRRALEDRRREECHAVDEASQERG